jgi:hypothetical protein
MLHRTYVLAATGRIFLRVLSLFFAVLHISIFTAHDKIRLFDPERKTALAALITATSSFDRPLIGPTHQDQAVTCGPTG